MGKNGFLSRFFGGKEKNEESARSEKSRRASEIPQCSHISFDNDLIRKLKFDHAELFRLLSELKTISEHGDFSTLPDLLTSFRITLQTHLMLENVKFYAYLQQNFEKKADLMTFISEVKKEMDGIAHVAIRFTNVYASQKMTKEKAAEFRKELEQIGEVLVKRVGLEETRLYTLYMPSY